MYVLVATKAAERYKLSITCIKSGLKNFPFYNFLVLLVRCGWILSPIFTPLIEDICTANKTHAQLREDNGLKS